MENFWLNLIIFLLLIGVGIICCFNAATYNDLANHDEDLGPISSPGGARALMWFNIIFAFLTFVFGLWYGWVLLFRRDDIKEKIYNKAVEFYETRKPVGEMSVSRMEMKERRLNQLLKEIEQSKSLTQQLQKSVDIEMTNM